MTTGEDTNVIVKKIGALIDVDINDTDISISHRIPSSNDGASGSTSFRHPAIVVKFTNRKNRDLFYKARSKLKSYSTSDIGLGRNGETKIYIQASVTEAGETGKQWRCEDVPKDRPPNNTTLLPWMI